MRFFKKQSLLIIGILVLLSIPLIIPLFHKGFFVTDDGEWSIIRFSAFYQALRDGQFPVRFVERLNFGYGYSVPTFLYPGFMYIGVIPHLLKISFVATIKIILGVSLVGSSIFAFLWLKKFFDDISSLVGALFYAYAPYHLYDLYVRGSVGEILALAILPFILWQIERKSIFWASFGIGLLILSHNTLAALFLILIIGYMFLDVFVAKKKNVLYPYLITLFLGIGLSAFFWIPILFELKHTVFVSTQVANWREYFAQIDLIGYAAFLVLFFTAFLFITKRVSIIKHRLTAFLFIVGIVSIFLSSSISYPLWNVLPVDFIQFPFRLLSVSILSISFLAAFVASSLKSIYKIVFIILCAILLYISTYKYITAVEFFDKGDDFYSTNEATTTVKDEYMPIWVKDKPTKRPNAKVEIINGVGSIENVFSNNKKTTFDLTLKKDSVIQINTIYWPGWSAFVDEREVQILYNNPEGVMRINAAKGEHKIRFNFGETTIRFIGNLMSIVSFAALCVIAMKGRKDNA